MKYLILTYAAVSSQSNVDPTGSSPNEIGTDTVDATGPRAMLDSQRRNTRRRSGAKPIRVAIIHNVDYDDFNFETENLGQEARADIADVAKDISEALGDGAHVVTIVPVEGDLWQMRQALLSFEADVAFNLCESVSGDARLESAVPLVLDGMGIPYTGSPPWALSSCLYKDHVKAILHRHNVPTPEAQVLHRPNQLTSGMVYPAIVKPTREDGSIGISSSSVVHSDEECRERVDEVVKKYRQPALVERFIAGREFNVAFFGFPNARILPLSEIDFSRLPKDLPNIVSYEAKWQSGSAEDLGTIPVTFPELPAGIAARIRKVASEAFRALGARDYGRVDLRLCEEDGTPYVVDVNPNCDLSRDAGLARSAAAVGIDYSAMMRLLVRYAYRRRREAQPVANVVQQALFRG
jgi:D-alanine-D-alanine ligase